eukprot:5932775-Amphidinium_carterae.1
MVGEPRSNVDDCIVQTECTNPHEGMKHELSKSSVADELPDTDEVQKHHGGSETAEKLTENSLSVLDQTKAHARPHDKRLSTLSLSSWSLSNKGEAKVREQGKHFGLPQSSAMGAHEEQLPKRCEAGTQTGIERTRRRPPVPSRGGVPSSTRVDDHLVVRRSADDVRKFAMAQRLHIATRICEGKAAVKGFRPTPLSTRMNSLSHLASRFNVAGVGCCSKHIAWTALFHHVSQELTHTCEEQPFCTAWQCPECLSLNEWEESDSNSDTNSDTDEEASQTDHHLCRVCGSFVTPLCQDMSRAQLESGESG